MPLHAELDHLVMAAQTLEQGVAWCEATLGATPAPGGKHPLMGTHNRLLSIAGPRFEQAYLEIIAIDPEAVPPGHARWFGLDDPSLQQALREGPRLVHFVARVPSLAAAPWRAACAHPMGRRAPGAKPAGQRHLAARDECFRPAPRTACWTTFGRPGGLMRAFVSIGLASVPVTAGPPGLHALLRGPRGDIHLQGGFGPWNA